MAQETNTYLKQYKELKAKYHDALLLFRNEDVYEIYEEDAEECAKILGIDFVIENKIKIAKFPFYHLDPYLPKLVRAGKRVAIC